MVHCCAAYNCTERYKKGGVSFHSFPTNQALREKWTKAVRRLNYKPTEYSKLCEKHFTQDCYETAPWSNMKRLKEGAVPTIFEFSPIKRRKYQKKSIEDHVDNCQERSLDDPDDENREVAASDKTLVGRNKQQITEMKSVKAKRVPKGKAKDIKSKDPEVNVYETLVEATEDSNLNNSPSSGMYASMVKSSSDEVETTPKIVSGKSVSSLPTKRCRKKKTFFGDFISEDWTLKSKRKKGDKLMQKTHGVVELDKNREKKKFEATQGMDDDLSKSEGNGKILVTSNYLVEKNSCGVQKGSQDISSVRLEKNCSLGETGADVHFVSEPGNKSCKLKSLIKPSKGKVKKQMMLQDQASPTVLTCNLNSNSLSRLDHYTIQENCADSDETDLGKCHKRKSLDKEQKSGTASSQKKVKKNVEILQNKSIDLINLSSDKDDQLINNCERQCNVGSDPAMPIIGCEEAMNHEKRTAVNIIKFGEGENEELAKQGNSTSNIQSCSATPMEPTSSQKLHSILKLNLEEEEAILKKCMLSSKGSKKGKLIRSKKAVDNNKDGPTGASRQNHESMDMSSDDDTDETSYLKRKYYIGDFKIEDLVSPDKAAKCLTVAQRVIREKDKRIKYLKQRERRLMKKVEELESVIFHIVEKKMNPDEASTVLIVLKDND